MARPLKIGLDYWPMDTDYFSDEKFQFIVAKCGLIGEIICVRLFAKIYRNGYFTRWIEDDRLLFAKNLNDGVTLEFVNNVTNEAIKRELFDKTMFNEFSILTSKGIQDRYMKICTDSRRINIVIDPNYSLLMSKPVLTPDKTLLTPDESTQRKGKEIERKGKEIERKENEREKEKEINSTSPVLDLEKLFYSDVTFVDTTSNQLHLTKDEFKKDVTVFFKYNQSQKKIWKNESAMKLHFKTWYNDYYKNL